MSNKFPITYQKVKKLPKISDGTRFYPASTASSNLFIARSQYYDTLIHQLPEGFFSIYHTQFSERIFSASVLESQKWYLVTILRFGDGIEMHPSYRSIFIAIQNPKLVSQYISDIPKIIMQKNSNKRNELAQNDIWNTDIERVFPNSVIYPISSRTYFPQCVSWTHYNSSLFMFTIFDNNIHTFEVTYDKSFLTYKINPINHKKGYAFHSVISSNIPHIYSINSGSHQSSVPFNLPQGAHPGENNSNMQNNINYCKSPFFVDATKPDIPIRYGLPKKIKVYPTTEFHVFITSSRRKITPPLNENRCIILANLDEISIVFPSSGYFLNIPHQYSIDEYIELTKKYNPKAKINLKKKKNEMDSKINEYVGFSQNEAYYRPASRMPLYLFKNDLILIAAPRGFITSVLIDQDDRIRASFVVDVFDPEERSAKSNVSTINTSNSSRSSNMNDNDKTNNINNNSFNNNINPSSNTSNNDNNNANDNNNNSDSNSNQNNNNLKSEDDDIRNKIFNMFSLNNKASLSLCENTGEIFKLILNASFFVSKDPRFVIPILHYFIRPKHSIDFMSNSYIISNKIINSITQLITEKSIQYFWNCEIFNEILLLQFNTSNLCSTFREKVCSTFVRSHFYKEWISLFEPYENLKNDTKKMASKMVPKPFIGSRTPDNENYMKGRSNSMIIDIDTTSSNKNNDIKISSKKKPPLSPIILSKRSPTDSNFNFSFSRKSDLDFNNDNSNSTFASNDEYLQNDDDENDEIDAYDESSISQSPPPTPTQPLVTTTTTPQMKGKNNHSSFYPNSLPKNKLFQNNNNHVPSQPINGGYYQEDVVDNSPKIRLSSVISTPTIYHDNEDDMMNHTNFGSANVFPIFNFRDIEYKAPKLALESLQMSDFQTFYKSILKIFNESVFFDLFQYPAELRFPLYMQFIAIRFALSEKPLYKSVFINVNYILENPFITTTVKEFWSALRMIPPGIGWRKPEFNINSKSMDNKVNNRLSKADKKKNFEKVKRQWWFLRSQECPMYQIEASRPKDNLFDFVEQITSKCKYGTQTFELHKNMFGFSMYPGIPNPPR